MITRSSGYTMYFEKDDSLNMFRSTYCLVKDHKMRLDDVIARIEYGCQMC